MPKEESSKEKFFYRDYKNVNVDSLLQDAANKDFDGLYRTNDANDQLCLLNSIVIDLFNSHIKVREFRVGQTKSCPWYNNNIIAEKALRDTAFAAYRELCSPERWRTYCKYRNRVNLMIRNSKREFASEYFDFKQPSKNIWRKIANLGILRDTDIGLDDTELTSDEFRAHFSSINVVHGLRTDTVFPEANNSFSLRNVTADEVYNSIFQVKSNAVGLDHVPLRFIKMLIPAILFHIVHVINTIFTTSSFPLLWKHAKIIPVPKKNNSILVSDFRPISIIPACSKVCERLIKSQIEDYISNFKPLYNNQSGFRKYHSTTSLMLNVTEKARQDLDRGKATIMVCLDFTKAFDSMNHAKLLLKLKQNFNFSSSLCDLIFSYLTERKNYVHVNNTISSSFTLHCGVPQGSILGPLLFSMYIDDFPNCISILTPHLFADDVQLTCSAPLENIDETIALVDLDLTSVSDWALENDLTLNPTKSQALVVYKYSLRQSINTITLNNSVIPFSAKINSLGIVMNELLNWDDHINKVCQTVYTCLKKLYLVDSFLSPATRKKLIQSLIVPHFTYAAEIYSGCSASCKNRLNVCINSCIRFIYSLRRFDSLHNFRYALFGFGVEKFFCFRILLLLFKVILFQSPEYLFSSLKFSRFIRTKQLIIPFHSTNYMSQSFFIRAFRYWNVLPIYLKNRVTLKTFRSDLLKYLLCSS